MAEIWYTKGLYTKSLYTESPLVYKFLVYRFFGIVFWYIDIFRANFSQIPQPQIALSSSLKFFLLFCKRSGS